jgi:Co/Zn/Cd efflux system component
MGLKNHARIGKAMRFASLESLPSLSSNPSHFLTLSCSSILVVLPLLSIDMYLWLDKILSGTIAISMCVLGLRLVMTLGSMLLMSYSGTGVSDVMRDIELDPLVTAVEEAKFWQVHYGLCMANLRLRVSGTEEGLTRLRERITSLIRNRLGGGYGTGGSKWEVSVEFTMDG